VRERCKVIDSIDSLTQEKKKADKSEVWKQARLVKNELLRAENEESEFTEESELQQWTARQRQILLPERDSDTNAPYDAAANPSKYIWSMISMMLRVEKAGKKSLNFFPLQRSSKNRHITIDTFTLAESFHPKGGEKLPSIGLKYTQEILQCRLWSHPIGRMLQRYIVVFICYKSFW